MVWLNMGEILRVNAKKFPKKLAVKDANRELNYTELNERVNRLGNGLIDMGLKKGDKVGILLYNNLVAVWTEKYQVHAEKWSYWLNSYFVLNYYELY